MKHTNIVIIDYGMGNLGSIKNMFSYAGLEAEISSDKNIIGKANKLILPGVGSFDKGMENINQYGLFPIIKEHLLCRKTPTLGICLGMQLLTFRSEEGTSSGLGFIDAEVKRFNFDGTNRKRKIPHMGWNYVNIKKQNYLIDGLSEDSRFYFVHSYYVKCNDSSDILLTSEYGLEFTSAFQRDNIMGVQFHPEKSHKFGMQIIKNFARI